MAQNNDRSKYISGYLCELDGLRAVSLILIVMFHTWQQSWIAYTIKLTESKYLINFEVFQRYGYVAIDSFFVLSGFCLFYPIARDMFNEVPFSGWKNFFIKRARKIYPAYILMLLLCLIFPSFSWITNDVSNPSELAKHFFSHAFFIHNFNAATQGSMLSTAWSLATEVQFYLMFPLICIPFRKKPVLTFISMSSIGIFVRLLLIRHADLSIQTYQATPFGYLDVFGCGMISSYFVVYARNKLKNIEKLKTLMTLTAISCVIAAIGYTYWLSYMKMPEGMSSGDVYFRFLYRGLFAAIIAGFIFTTCFSHTFWRKNIWGNRFFIFLSSISYTVYLCHQNIYILLKRLNIPYSAMDPVMIDREAMEGQVLICLTASIIIGVLVTKYVEKPISRYGYKNCLLKIMTIIKQNKKKQIMLTNKNDILSAATVCLSVAFTLIVVWCFTGKWPWANNVYNSYIIQVQSWLSGRLDVDNRSWLELAIYNNKYFVSFPPFPSYIMLPFVALGWNNCDGFISFAFVLAGAVYIYKLLRTFNKSPNIAALWTLFVMLGTNILFTSITPQVWFIAQTMCFTLLIISIYYAKIGKGGISLAAWACAVGCRPFSALYIFLIAYLLYENIKTKYPGTNILKLVLNNWKWYIAPLTIALSYMFLNYARFGNPIEFGHNYLPEFMRTEAGQFSVQYLKKNINKLFRFPTFDEDQVISLPLVDGFCFLIVSPLYITYIIYSIRTLIKCDKMNKCAMLITFITLIIELLCIATHKTMGGAHFGNRYTNDTLPLALFGIMICPLKNERNDLFNLPLIVFGFTLNLIGTVLYFA